MLVRDENSLPITSTENFWSHIVKTLFVTADGLGTLQSVLTVTLDAMTISKPHVTSNETIEEVWDESRGKQYRFHRQQASKAGPGVAYLHPLDIHMPHCNINDSEEAQDKFFYFARYHNREPRK